MLLNALLHFLVITHCHVNPSIRIQTHLLLRHGCLINPFNQVDCQEKIIGSDIIRIFVSKEA